MKIWCVVPDKCSRTDKYTDKHGHHNTPLLYRRQSDNVRRDLVVRCCWWVIVDQVCADVIDVLHARVVQDELFHGPRRHSLNSALMRRPPTDAEATSSSSDSGGRRWVRNRQTARCPVPASDHLECLRLSNKSRTSRKIFTHVVNSVARSAVYDTWQRRVCTSGIYTVS